MKKLIMILVACSFLTSLEAQTDIYWGMKAGLNLSTQKVDNPLASYSMQPGFNVGAFFYFAFPKFVIQPEILLSQQGANIEFEGEDLYTRFRYLSVPIMFKHVLKSGVRFELGPQIGFLLCNKSNYHPILNTKFEEQSYTSAYKSTDFLIAFGVGWESKKKWIVGARYSLGLTSINDHEGIPDTKNQVLSINVGYKIVKFNK